MGLLLGSILFYLFCEVNLLALAANLTIEGDGGTITGFLETNYTAHFYRPICGQLAPSQFNESLNVLDTCQDAMEDYKNTTDTFALYNLTGGRQPDTLPIAVDTDLCMCFSLADLNSRSADFCILVNKNGTTTDYIDDNLQAQYDHPFAVGSFELGNKTLPHCSDINVTEVISSLDAAANTTDLPTVQNPPIVANVTVDPPLVDGNSNSSSIPLDTFQNSTDTTTTTTTSLDHNHNHSLDPIPSNSDHLLLPARTYDKCESTHQWKRTRSYILKRQILRTAVVLFSHLPE
jgi:hypothetical protein